MLKNVQRQAENQKSITENQSKYPIYRAFMPSWDVF